MEKEFLNIVDNNQGIILKVCRMYCNDREDAEDIFQEIVLQLWRSYPKFRGDAKLSTWVYRIALNVAITRLRKIGREIKREELSLRHENLSENDNSPMDMHYQVELQQAINSLNRFDKALIMLYLEEKTYLEMAEIMEISEGNVAVKINRIKKKLKTLIVQ